MNISLVDVLTIAALVLGPIFAIQIQKILERAGEAKRRKTDIFRTLMATRDPESRVSKEHVQALNMIDIEYYGAKKLLFFNHRTASEKAVLKAWRKYLEHLNLMAQSRDITGMIPPHIIKICDDLFIELLDKVAQSLEYDFDETELRRGMYKPEYAVRKEKLNNFIDFFLPNILSGNQAIAVKIISHSEPSIEISKDELSK